MSRAHRCRQVYTGANTSTRILPTGTSLPPVHGGALLVAEPVRLVGQLQLAPRPARQASAPFTRTTCDRTQWTVQTAEIESRSARGGGRAGAIVAVPAPDPAGHVGERPLRELVGVQASQIEPAEGDTFALLIGVCPSGRRDDLGARGSFSYPVAKALDLSCVVGGDSQHDWSIGAAQLGPALVMACALLMERQTDSTRRVWRQRDARGRWRGAGFEKPLPCEMPVRGPRGLVDSRGEWHRADMVLPVQNRAHDRPRSSRGGTATLRADRPVLGERWTFDRLRTGPRGQSTDSASPGVSCAPRVV